MMHSHYTNLSAGALISISLARLLLKWRKIYCEIHHSQTTISSHLQRVSVCRTWWFGASIHRKLLASSSKNMIDIWECEPFLIQTQMLSVKSCRAMPSFQARWCSSLRNKKKSAIHHISWSIRSNLVMSNCCKALGECNGIATED